MRSSIWYLGLCIWYFHHKQCDDLYLYSLDKPRSKRPLRVLCGKNYTTAGGGDKYQVWSPSPNNPAPKTAHFLALMSLPHTIITNQDCKTIWVSITCTDLKGRVGLLKGPFIFLLPSGLKVFILAI